MALTRERKPEPLSSYDTHTRTLSEEDVLEALGISMPGAHFTATTPFVVKDGKVTVRVTNKAVVEAH